jgi:oxygen-dependent protoporphyrinogen oxidase
MTTHSPRLIVVGGGVAGLAAARAALDIMPELDVRVLERAPLPGGLVETEHTPEGFLIEQGADCIVTAKPAALAAVQRFGLGDALQAPTAAASTTFIARGVALVPLPAGVAFGAPASLLEVLVSGALSPAAKARMACEPWLPPNPTAEEDESVAAFLGRRFGAGFLRQVAEPVLESVYGAPASELSACACLPRLRTLEQQAGSVVRGLRRGRANRSATQSPVLSLRRGMGSLVDALVHALPLRVHTSIEVADLARGPSRTFRLRLRDGEVLETDALIIATQAHTAAALSERLSPALAELLSGIRYGRLDCLSLAFPRAVVPHPLNGGGFVVPRAAGRTTRACTWSSSKWAGRAPAEFVLIRSVLDGADASDDELMGGARRDLAELLGIHAQPAFTRLRRRHHGLPVQDLGCLERSLRVHAEAAKLDGLALAGSAHGAMGVSDCIESGQRAAAQALQRRFGAERC